MRDEISFHCRLGYGERKIESNRRRRSFSIHIIIILHEFDTGFKDQSLYRCTYTHTHTRVTKMFGATAFYVASAV